MPDTPHVPLSLPATIERLLLESEPESTLDWCMFRIGLGRDSGHVWLHVLPTADEAQTLFARDGNAFVAPKLSSHVQQRDGTVTDYTPPQLDLPILSHESLANLGDENFLWRGYGNNKRGVIKMRVGRFLADLNVPTVADAERLARRVVDLLR
jgi:hypothetical protein